MAEYAGDGNFTGTTNSLSPVQLVNTPPAPGAGIMERSPTNGSKILVSSLLGNDADADGDTITLVSFSATSTNGGAVTRNGDWIFYTPVAGFTNQDAFAYTITDVHGATALGLVHVLIKNDAVPSPNLLIVDLGGGSYLIRFDGIPGTTYRVEYNDDVQSPLRRTRNSATANESGLFQITDVPPPNGSPQRYYRSVYP